MSDFKGYQENGDSQEHSHNYSDEEKDQVPDLYSNPSVGGGGPGPKARFSLRKQRKP
jgi:hypothetical protein